MKHISEIIEDILVEWAYRVHDGMPNIKNPQHITELRESMEELNLPNNVIYQVIENLINEEDVMDKKIKYKTDDGEEKEATVGGILKQGEEHPAYKQARQMVDKENPEQKTKQKMEYPTSDKYMKSQTQKGSTEKIEKITDDLVNGNLDELRKSHNELTIKRALGISGMGGAAASHGEAVFADAVNTLPNYDDLYNEEDREKTKKHYQKLKERTNFPKSGEESEMFEVFGWDKNNPAKEAYEYFTKRELFAQKNLEEIIQDSNSVFYKKGRAGFNEDPEAYKAWMTVAFDGAMATKEELENNSNIDTSKPYLVVQSEDGSDSQDNAIIKSLEKTYEETGETYYKKQLNLMKKFNYHDTFAVGQNSEGKMSLYHISNKKASNITDPHNNTTPAKRIKVMQESGISGQISKNVGKVLQDGFDDVSDVKQSTIRKTQDVVVSDDLGKLLGLLESKYIKEIENDLDFTDYVKDNNISYTNNKEKLLAIQRYVQDKNSGGEKVSYKFGKLFAKMGEEGRKKKVQQANSDINFQDRGILDSIQIKEDEKNMVKGTYQKIVKSLEDEDKEQGYPDKNGNNGPNVQAYITTVLDSLHINTYIENYDGDCSLTMGGRVAQPKDIRTCLSELSNFKGDIDTPDGRIELKNHLKKQCKIDGEFGGVVTKGPNGNLKLFKDEWRSAGTSSQKVASYFGKDVQKCLKGKIDTRRQEQTKIGK